MTAFEIDPIQRVFATHIFSTFSFLREDFGFNLLPISSGSMEARSRCLVIKIELDVFDVYITLEPGKKRARVPKHCLPLVPLGINTLAECLDPNIDLVPSLGPDERFFAEEQVPRQLREGARVLRACCRPFLEGDFRLWPSVRALQQFIDSRLQLMSDRQSQRLRRAISAGAAHLLY